MPSRLSNGAHDHDNDPSPWSLLDVGALIGAFTIRWQVGLAFLALKMWHQISGSRLSTFAFIADRWSAAVEIAKGLFKAASDTHEGRGAVYMKPKPGKALQLTGSSGNLAFDDWQREEIERINRDTAKLTAEREEFERYKESTQRGKDQAEFDRFLLHVEDRDRRRGEID